MKLAAGQIYKAPAQRGHRYLMIDQVRSPAQCAYALCHEVNAKGEHVSGWLHGVYRGHPFAVALVWTEETGWAMPSWYERHEVTTEAAEENDDPEPAAEANGEAE